MERYAEDRKLDKHEVSITVHLLGLECQRPTSQIHGFKVGCDPWLPSSPLTARLHERSGAPPTSSHLIISALKHTPAAQYESSVCVLGVRGGGFFLNMIPNWRLLYKKASLMCHIFFRPRPFGLKLRSR